MKGKRYLWLLLLAVFCLLASAALASGTGKIVRITNHRNVNVRNGPDAGYKAIGSAKPGETFEYLGTRDNWNCIQYMEGVTGYVSGKLSVVEDAPASAVQKPVQKPVQTDTPAAAAPVNTEIAQGAVVRVTNYRNVNVRSGPAKGYDAIGSEKPESVFAYLGTQDGWHCIQYGYGRKGYIAGSLCVVEDAPQKKKNVRVTHERTVNVRTGPGTGYDVIGEVSPEETFAYLGTQDGWHCIRFDGNATGYVSGNLTSVEFEGQPLEKPEEPVNSGGSSDTKSSQGGHWEWQYKWRWEWKYGSDGLPYQVRTNSPVQVWVPD